MPAAKLNLALLLANVFSSLGVDQEDKGIKKLLSEKSLEAINVEEDTAKLFSENYFTKDSAVNNPEIRDLLKKEIAKEYDLTGVFKDLNIGDEDFKKISSQKKFADKVKQIAETFHAANKGETGDDIKKSLNAKIAELNGELAKKDDEFKLKLENMTKAQEAVELNSKFERMLSGMPFINKKADAETNNIAALTILDRELASKKIKRALVNGELKFMNEDGSEYFEKNKPVNPSDFVKNTLIAKGLIDNSLPSTKTKFPVSTTPPDPTKPPVNFNRHFKGGQSFSDFVKELPEAQL